MKAIGVILAGGNNKGRLGQLTENRAAAALPIASSYRAIDFVLSNMSNSGIGKVAVLTQYNSRSLRDHLTSSKWWDFGRKQGGLFVFTPYISSTESNWFRGTADSIYQNISYLLRSTEEYVVVTSGDAIYKIDYSKVINQHVESGADITVVYKKMEDNLRNFGIMEMNEAGRMIGFEEKPEQAKTNCASLGMYVISRTLLIDLLTQGVPEGKYDWVGDYICENKDTLQIYGYEFEGYWSTISTGIIAYYKTNMDFLKKEVRNPFINEYPYIETKAKDEPPAKYNVGADVRGSIVGSGTIFNGVVESSVIFRKVFVGEGASVKHSIIMEGTTIGKGCKIEYAILDKDVVVSDGKDVIGTLDYPVVLKKGTVI
ncbi:glucose-1-phosphate adenylyltransferase subunit GlgD [Chakrabartyella piscis]|uniref:glucose-1-phosphate adenylyltransferase subunit GlgD n=1 Tax=Chakrabartyella piscis TaxID=2918914 RepID=UPI002958C1B1|nr:glucose-1-phosphate adenylyltransferase subunit GlgD [Chakrabartyella piscis]